MSRVIMASAGTAALLLTAACGDDKPAAQPITPSKATATAGTPTATTTPPPKPKPRAVPLSRFERDPAVKAMREFSKQAALAVNAKNLALPGLNAVSTPFRQQRNKINLAEDLGGYAPGPFPRTPLAVQIVSASERRIPTCSMVGWVLTAKGGKPRKAQKVVSATATLKLVGGRWKVDGFAQDTARDCAGVKIHKVMFP